MRRKGFTLVELLVVIAIIALLMGILMPALARVRQLAFRMTCGTNLSGIGKAMLIYANDYDDELPRAGERTATWGTTNWAAADRLGAYGTGSSSRASLSSCLYLLVKYAEVTPKSFICKSDTGTSEFEIADEQGYVAGMELIDAWDFGARPYEHCSYTYHYPFGTYALTTSSEPGLAVAADRNPWLSSPAGEPDLTKFTAFNPTGGTEAVRAGNSITHQGDGQNVMYLDTHVEFTKTSACSLEEDNIYTKAANGTVRGDPKGASVAQFGVPPANRKDSLLVHDPVAGASTGGPVKGRACFTGNTIVWVDGAMQSIAKATAGQTVGLHQVEQLQAHTGSWAVCHDVILENGDCITVIGSHLFRLASGQFVPVQQLRHGVDLDTMNGSVKVAWVVKRTTPYVGTVYNLKVQDADEYFVGKTGVVVRDF
ncbi:MAG: prepilin-type N-terminal cleavage/methylation domain-containing protein [Sedimentisphaerales bacterium]|nr:prepilin-type N-terminal cleavage/methylation domain-containing protein [Sedimentisphaerales bacterium]